jgi:hypothetical protein
LGADGSILLPPPTHWNVSRNSVCGIITDGNVISVGGSVSRDKGATWEVVGPYYPTINPQQLFYLASGPNGAIAYDSVSKATATANTSYDGKYNITTYYLSMKNPALATGGNPTGQFIASTNLGSNIYPPIQVLYWPLVGFFYSPLRFQTQLLYINRATGSNGTFTWAGIIRQPMCINPSNGYLYISSNGTVFVTTVSDFSDYSSVGSDAYYASDFQAVPVKGPNGYWYKTANSTGSNSVMIVSSDNTTTPTGWTNSNYYSVPYSGTLGRSPQLYFEGARLWLSGDSYIYDGKGGYYDVFFNVYSDDYGSSWSSVQGNSMSLVKNLQS